MEDIIAVIGGESCTDMAARMAEEVGRELAQRGFTLICGGRGGVMEAACRGAKDAGGRTIGVLPGNDAEDANPYLDIAIITGMGMARNVIIVRSAQAVIAVDGHFGTLSEIGHALSLGIPVIGLETWDLSRGGNTPESIIVAKDPKDAVEKALLFRRNQ